MPAEQKLLERIADHNEEAFKDFFGRYAERIFKYAMLRTRNRHLAEEVVQETMLAVWQNAASHLDLWHRPP